MTTDKKFSNSDVATMLHKAGIRPSLQRVAVLSFIGNYRTHPSAEEVYRELSAELPTLSRTTVYNTLHSLVDKKLVREIDIEPTVTRYDLALWEPHGHFKCLLCGRIFDVRLASCDSDLPPGFAVDALDVFYKGVCPECQGYNK